MIGAAPLSPCPRAYAALGTCGRERDTQCRNTEIRKSLNSEAESIKQKKVTYGETATAAQGSRGRRKSPRGYRAEPCKTGGQENDKGSNS